MISLRVFCIIILTWLVVPLGALCVVSGAAEQDPSRIIVGAGMLGVPFYVAASRRKAKPGIDGRGDHYGDAWVQLGYGIDARHADGGATVRRVTKLRAEYEQHGGLERLWAWEDAVDAALGLVPEAVIVQGRVYTFRYGAPAELKARRDVQPSQNRVLSVRYVAEHPMVQRALRSGDVSMAMVGGPQKRWTGQCGRCRYVTSLRAARRLDGEPEALCDDCVQALVEILTDIDDRAL